MKSETKLMAAFALGVLAYAVMENKDISKIVLNIIEGRDKHEDKGTRTS